MANTILSGLFSKGSARIVNATSGGVVCVNLKIVEADIELTATVFKHKMEDGQIQADARVQEPAEVHVSAFVPDYFTLDEVNKVLRDRNAYYNLIIKDVVWMTLVCANEEMEQSAEVINATPITLSFKEIIKAVSTDKPAEQNADENTRQRGDVQPQNTTTTVEQANQQVLGRM